MNWTLSFGTRIIETYKKTGQTYVQVFIFGLCYTLGFWLKQFFLCHLLARLNLNSPKAVKLPFQYSKYFFFLFNCDTHIIYRCPWDTNTHTENSLQNPNPHILLQPRVLLPSTLSRQIQLNSLKVCHVLSQQ